MLFSACAEANDLSLGPTVLGCRGDFDFTVQFEQVVFSLAPAAVFIVASLWRVALLARRRVIVDAPILRLAKLLILIAVLSFGDKNVDIAACVLRLVAALCMMGLSWVDHSRSPRPSMFLSAYLLLSLLFDVAQVRTYWLASSTRPEIAFTSIFTAALGMKVAMLLLEAQRKTQWVTWDSKDHSPEETSGIYSLGVYYWLNQLFFEGYNKVLEIRDLYPLDQNMAANLLSQRLAQHVDSVNLKKENLTQRLSEPSNELPANVGYGFIGASIAIYASIAVSTAFYWYFHHRMLYMARGTLVTAIYTKTIEARISNEEEKASLTLMSTDVEKVMLGFRFLHEFWANLIEVALASWLLYNYIGPAFVAPIVIVLICTGGIAVLMSAMDKGQKAWMSAVQKRVGLTSNVIANVKNIKLSGLTDPITRFVEKLRVNELKASSDFRGMFLVCATFAYIPLLAGPAITFGVAQRSLDAAKLFTSLSYILLMAVPLNTLFQTIPQFIAGVACLHRIEEFLQSEKREDFRIVSVACDVNEEKLSTSQSVSLPAVVVKNGSFGWQPDKMALNNIDIEVPRGALTMIVGPIASGKSTLIKTLLGEIPYHQGTVSVATNFPRIGYCDQTPFLSNGSIRDNIVGFSPFDPQRYAEVIDGTMLSIDFETLPQGDRSNVGSNGITLSGGQKQRVSLARSLYLQSDLLIMDDVFSGLDADTEDQVFQRVFGPNGILRRRQATVILCTHSIRHLPAASHVIALGSDGTIVEQGSFLDINANQSYIHSLGVKSSSTHQTASDKSGFDSVVAEFQDELYREISTVAPEPQGNEKARLDGDSEAYKVYLKSMGIVLASSLVLCGVLFGFFYNIPTIWLKYWSDDVGANPSHSFSYYAGIYALLEILAMISLAVLGTLLYITVITKSGTVLHHNALHTLVRAPLSFFTKTDQGIVTNLFSQDLNLIDNELPISLLNVIYTTFVALGQAAVIATSSPYLAISYPFLILILYGVQKFYLRTSRQLRLLDLEAKSPLYTHFLDTSKGIVTIRAFGFTDEDQAKNAFLLDTSQCPTYLLTIIQQWLNFVLNVIVAILAIALTSLAVRLRSNSGFTGASLVTLMAFGDNLSGIVVFYTLLETSLGAISRLKAFDKTAGTENKDEEDMIPPEEWPQRGGISLKGVSAAYKTDDETETPNLALKNIQLEIRPGENIAICGRTGSGKSSLIALLLKLLDPIDETPDNVYIDNTSLRRIDRATLRQRIIAIPQDVVFLPDGSTFQENLDPYNLSTVAEAQAVLEVVDLWSFVQERGGLEAGMTAGTLSQGQRQLFSLARAVLRRRIRARSLGLGGGGSEGGILLLDEVSSSVDKETEKAMQEVIRVEFKEYTVVAVSHRLDMVMDYDTVVVMDKGEIVEVGNPAELAAQAGTRFGVCPPNPEIKL
ncbi:hypothetical protein M426DRAFT_18072 [Hypoxylon sp. CI-4A]|nr:hypothetical protein M426DRAFT_18072 [Hypoxylon sp. CI-4A]